MDSFYSNGKLLISAEYLVLDGANALALPTQYGQFLKLKENQSGELVWNSYDVQNQCWFTAVYNIKTLELLQCKSKVQNAEKVAATLKEILQTAKNLNKHFLLNNGVEVTTHLTFPNEWGLGTSSTLINNIASWANVNAFQLLEMSFGGSGYDIACAQNNNPIVYKRNEVSPIVKTIDFNPVYKDQLFFVYLNQKQDSKEGIQMYRSLELDKQAVVDKINKITYDLLQASTLAEFEELLTTHEAILSDLLSITPVKQKLFSDFNGAVKSLGAWGGDFVLVTGKKEYVTHYFKTKGYKTILDYKEMILD